MTNMTKSPTPTKHRIAILLLLATHFATALTAAFFSADHVAVSSAIFLAVIFAQTCLLGIWGGVGNARGIVRAACLLGGNYLMYRILVYGIDESPVFLLVTTTTVSTALLSWIARLFCIDLRWRVDDVEISENPRYSIWHLMKLTTVMAVLLTVGNVLSPHLSQAHVAIETITLGLCYASAALAACWSTMGLASPWGRVPAAVMVAFGAGVVATYAFGETEEVPFWMATVLLQTAIAMATFLAMRLLGYRLAWKKLL